MVDYYRFQSREGWSDPKTTDVAGKATVKVVTLDEDGGEVLVTQDPATGEDDAGDNWILTTSGRRVLLSVGAEHTLPIGTEITIQYGN